MICNLIEFFVFIPMFPSIWTGSVLPSLQYSSTQILSSKILITFPSMFIDSAYSFSSPDNALKSSVLPSTGSSTTSLSVYDGNGIHSIVVCASPFVAINVYDSSS